VTVEKRQASPIGSAPVADDGTEVGR